MPAYVLVEVRVTNPEPYAGYRDLAGGAPARLDLSTGTPDPELLPLIGPALSRVALQRPAADTGAYVTSPVVPALEVLLRDSWPFAPQRITVVDGALEREFRSPIDLILIEAIFELASQVESIEKEGQRQSVSRTRTRSYPRCHPEQLGHNAGSS